MHQRHLVQSTPLALLWVRTSDQVYWRCWRLSTNSRSIDLLLMHPGAGWHAHGLRSLCTSCAGLVQLKEGMSLCAFANHCAARVLRQLLWLSEPQLLNLALGRADHGSSTAVGLLCAQRAGQLMPAHQSLRAHPQSTVPHVLDVILHGASLRAGRSPKDAAPRLGACSFAPRRNVLMMACEVIQRYQISAKSDHRSRTTQRCLENRCSL